jgi:hypothetical protein
MLTRICFYSGTNINTSKLDLYVDGNPHVYLVTNGQINAFPMGDNEIDVKKMTVGSIKGF